MLQILGPSLIVHFMMELLSLEPEMESRDIFPNLLCRTELPSFLNSISKGPNELAIFMHTTEQRKCECLIYVAAAAEIGVLHEGQRFEEGKKNCNEAKFCAKCQVFLANPKICSRCRQAAYCGADHQPQHWKDHKKSCRDIRSI
mmetsp:Transcript_19782/g.52597  ORF Transcript_19782/g.52597 Transcript_19782/m.52597 type:complete len:144 (+) Transcript_19782:3-434(+)